MKTYGIVKMARRFIFHLLFSFAVFAVLRSLAVSQGTIDPLPKPPELKPDEVSLGKMLFFEARLSGDGSISCATCHIPQKAFSDGDALSAGYPSTLYFRNTPSLLNAVFKKWLYWDGRLPGSDLPTVVRDHLSEAHFMQADGRLLVERLRQIPEYEEAFKKAYGGEPSYGKILNAVSAYVKSLVSRDAPIDRYLSGDNEALSQAAKKGLELFKGKAGCVSCHSGALLTDENFHNLGVPENPAVFNEPLRHVTFRRFLKTLGVEGYHGLQKDVGFYAVTKEGSDTGKFKTPSLREVSKTAPYMHNGIFTTLEEAVDFYDKGGGDGQSKDTALKPLALSPDEKKELIEFLKASSGKEETIESPTVFEYKLRMLGEN